ncbi:DUF1566 domain-containing protein [Flagellimonas olearia]|uniref:DUF1566 domain-containing protein n=2 Tax=Flagellimonas olearia TaxID=552546 RepID=A0A6I1E027_9FLAO|nr:DUF1566 domain-containing protein [Allomuricauda olearia]
MNIINIKPKIMNKKIKQSYLFILSVLLITIGCSNDDDAGSNIEVGLQDLEVTIDENPTDGQVIGTIGTDGSAGQGFSITSQTPSGALSIDPTSGEVTVDDASLFDFEANSTLTASVTAENAENTVTVTVNLNNVSEVSAQSLEVTMDENPVDGQSIGTLQTNGSASGFTITSQSPTGAMSINSGTGELTVADATLFDYESNPTLTATVSMEDAQNPVSVTVNLNDVLEITIQDFTVTVDENPNDGQVLGNIQANGNGTLSYSITAQSPMGAMAINTGTGELTVLDPNLFDFETNPVITADISVTDGTESISATATINLNDVDEVSATNTNLTIDENPSNGDVIGVLQSSGSNLTYTITFQNPAGAFNINQNTGELSVADETLFDFETNPNMLATISVSNGTQTVSANAFVALNDLNEIGEFKYGGVIFWIDPASNNSSGLVVSLNVQATNVPWGCLGIATGATGTAIGTGQTNTDIIMASSCASGSAAEIASNLNENGFDDWFLPSADELNELYSNVSIVGNAITSNGGDVISNSYWSSTEVDINDAIWWNINQGFNIPKDNDFLSVRAIRAFTDF